ncbi:MAG TPA: R3H domain-containing nucleic acid-binding protein [Bryobacteraceae bacterium]|nr:R3H domain-containing nucleic acid-binding protein [Bryobacteraceae bacterium]
MSEEKTIYNIDTAGEKIEGFLDAVLDTMDLDVTYEFFDGEETKAYFEGPSLVVKFEGAEIEHLLANKGEALLALEQLTQEVLRMAPDEHAKICFDANDFRLLRQEELRLGSLTVAEQVRESGQPFRFNPMNSRERRIIHLALRDHTDLRTESAGTGPFRHVVVYPAGMASLPDPPQPPMGARRDSGDHGGRGGDRRGGGGGRRDDRRGGGGGGNRRGPGGGGGRDRRPPRRDH